MLTIKTIFPVKENVCTTREVVEEEDREDQSGQVNIQMSGGGSFHLQVYKDWTSHHQGCPLSVATTAIFQEERALVSKSP